MPPTAGIKRVLLILAVLAGVVATLLAFPRGPSAYLVSPDKCVLTGSFSRNGAYTTTVFPDPADAGEIAFGSWSGNDSYTGKFSSSAFRAPRLINLFVSGYPRKEGISLYLEDAVRNGRRLALEARADPRESWRRFEWTLPAGWRGQIVRLVAEDRSQALGGWIGVTLPREGGAQSALPRLGTAAAFAAAMGAEGVLFLLPGFVLAVLLERRFALDGFRFTAAAITAAATVGYLAFWVYFADVGAGKVASWLVSGASLAAAPVLLRRGWKRSAAVWREFAVAAALVFAVAWFYLGVGYLYKAGDPANDLQAADRVTLWQLPPDHLLPWELADHVYREAPLRPHLMSYWKSSDRPPLQAGIVLAQLPFWQALRGKTHYHLLAIFLQSLWAGALWIFLCSAGVARRTVLIVLGLCVFSGFFFLYSFYVWPKLLAAALFLIGLTLSTFNRPDYRWTACDAALSGTAIALGMLSHTGVLLAAPGILWVLYRNRALPGPRIAARAAATVLPGWRTRSGTTRRGICC